MKIIAISSLGANHRYVLEQVHAHFPIEQVLRPISPPPAPVSRMAKVSRWVRQPVRSVVQRLGNRHFQRRLQRLEQDVARDLQLDLASPTRLPVQPVAVSELHSPALRDQLQRLQPDVMLTSGCPLLQPSLFELPRLGTINLHWGISPAYRGEHTLFWPLYFRDDTQLGFTLHQIDASIDGGPILARGWPAFTGQEDEATMLARSARLAAPLLVRLCEQIERSKQLTGRRPTSRGRLFKRRQRRWRHDFWLACRRPFQHKLRPPLPAREEWLLDRVP